MKFISFEINLALIISSNSSTPIFSLAENIITSLSLYFLISSTLNFSSLSDLLSSIIAFLSFTLSSNSISSLSKGKSPSITTKFKSALLLASIAFCTPILSTTSSVCLIPAVSVIFKLIPDSLIFSVNVSLVVPAISVTIALSVLERRFKMEDFPAFGFPIMTVFIPSFIILPSLNDFFKYSILVYNFFTIFLSLSLYPSSE